MNATDIRRIRAVPEINPEPTIIEEAASVLGYGYSPAAKLERISALASRLAELEIDTLNQDDVLRYQCEQAAEAFLDDEFVRKMSITSANYRWNHISIWERIPIASYKEAVPEFVLNKAVQIKKAMPDVSLYIEHMEMRPDPFLVVKTDGDTWSGDSEYVEVWDEPKFEGRTRP